MAKIVALCLVALAGCVFAETAQKPEVDSGVQSRIVGGVNAGIGAAPYQVSLRTDQGHFCGGAIISNSWILTSALCVNGRAPNQVLVVVGTNTLNGGGEGYNVNRIVVHNQFNPNTKYNDIALVQTNRNIQYNQYVKPIALANVNTNGGLRATLTGWGYLSANGQIPNYLQTVDLFTTTYDDCRRPLQNIDKIIRNQLCATNGFGKGACNGDTGGPLVSGGKLVGILSWGLPCATGVPDVYSRVFSYRGWIRGYAGV